MTQEEKQDRDLRSIARSMEAEGANYECVLHRMRAHLKELKKLAKTTQSN